jgi:hypothetical protein
MSRAITFRFGESAGLRIMIEQGLNNEVYADIKGDMGHIASSEIKANMEGLHVQEMQVDFAAIHGIDTREARFPQIRYSKEGVMTFIEIIIPNSSNYGDLDIEHKPVSESILEKSDILSAKEQIAQKEDVVDRENVILDVPELMEFSLEPGLRDVIKSLEKGDKDFSVNVLEGAFDIPKSLPSHEDLMDFRDLMNILRKREKVKVKNKTSEKKN